MPVFEDGVANAHLQITTQEHDLLHTAPTALDLTWHDRQLLCRLGRLGPLGPPGRHVGQAAPLRVEARAMG